MAQTIEAFVGNALDEAKISPLHRRVIGLIAAGYFFDVIDFTIFGSLVPFILQSKFATGAEVAAGRQRHHLRHVHRHRGPGPIQRPVRPPLHLSVQPAAVRRVHDPRRVRAERHVAGHLPLYRRHRPWRRAAAGLRLCRRIFAQANPRPHSCHRAFHRRRLRVADRNRAGASASALDFRHVARHTSGAASG